MRVRSGLLLSELLFLAFILGSLTLIMSRNGVEYRFTWQFVDDPA